MKKNPFGQGSNRVESVLNGVLVAVFVGAALWAAVGPSVLTGLTQA